MPFVVQTLQMKINTRSSRTCTHTPHAFIHICFIGFHFEWFMGTFYAAAVAKCMEWVMDVSPMTPVFINKMHSRKPKKRRKKCVEFCAASKLLLNAFFVRCRKIKIMNLFSPRPPVQTIIIIIYHYYGLCVCVCETDFVSMCVLFPCKL